MGGSIINEHLKDFYIPSYIIIPGSEAVHVSSSPPSCPVLVFINTKSGGQLGGELLGTYSSILNPNQVFDLGKTAPEKVLSQIYNNLEKLKQGKDSFASEIQKRLRIIVAGGDGTAGWILGVVYDLKLPHSPPVATVPLGTGNNLPFSFGWGKKNPGTDRQSVEAFLEHVRTAREMNVDSWHIHMKMKAPKEAHLDPIPILDLPNSLHAIHRVSEDDVAVMEKYLTFQGGFWNYFSMGMDAQVSYAFHTERKLHPEKFKSQMGNQSAYLKLGCTQGWFCPSLHHPSSGNIGRLAKVKVMSRDGQWEELMIPKSIRSILCLNLPSFSGGLNPWGTPATRKSHDRGLAPPYVDDGLLEIVGFKDAWHGLVLLAPGGHGTRLAQANGIQFEFHKGAAEHTYMRIDGEPWKQPLPLESDKVVIEISHLGQVKMLARPYCRSKSIHHESPSSSPHHHASSSASGSSSSENGTPRKIGAANTFRLSDEIKIDIS